MANPKEVLTGREDSVVPEPLSDETLADLLNFACNDESKLLTLCSLQPGVIYDLSSINSRVKEVLGNHQSPYAGHTVFRDYLKKSLLFSGAVIGTYGQDGEVGCALSSEKSIQAIALAGHLLRFSEQNPEFSLGATLSRSSSSGKVNNSRLTEGGEGKKRAPSTRVRMFREILAQPTPIRITDLANSLGEFPTALKKHLDNLASSGIVNYEFAASNEPLVAYRLTQAVPTSDFFNNCRYPNLSQDLYSSVAALTGEDKTRRAYLDELVTLVQSRTTGRYIHGKEIMGARVSALKVLARNGFIAVERFDGSMRSEISLSGIQRFYLSELVGILDRFQSQDPAFIREGLQTAGEIISDSNRVYALMAKAKNYSPNANSKPEFERRTEVLDVFPAGQSLQAKDLQKLFEQRFGRRLSRGHINELLGQLAETGFVEYRIEKNHKYWNLSQAN